MAVRKEFNDKEVERILKQLFYHPLSNIHHENRAIVNTQKRYVDYLIEHNLVSKVNVQIGGSDFPLSLNKRGFDVFEKYNGWPDYKKKVIDSKEKIIKYKELAIKWWWLPVVISILALIVSGLAIVFSK